MLCMIPIRVHYQKMLRINSIGLNAMPINNLFFIWKEALSRPDLRLFKYLNTLGVVRHYGQHLYNANNVMMTNDVL